MNNKPRTLEEIYQEVGKLPFKVRHETEGEGCYSEVLSVIVKEDNIAFCGFHDVKIPFAYTSERREWYLIPPEKKKIVRWLWADKAGDITPELYNEDERADVYPSYFIKLEWSRTEFEVG